MNLSNPVSSAYEEDRLYEESLLVIASLLLLLLLLLLLWALLRLAVISTGPICCKGGGLGNNVSTAIGKIPPDENRSGDAAVYKIKRLITNMCMHMTTFVNTNFF